jgi:hypothetical protein
MIRKIFLPVLAVGAALAVIMAAPFIYRAYVLARAFSSPPVGIALYPPGVPTNGPADAICGRIKITTDGDVTTFWDMLGNRELRQTGRTYRVEMLTGPNLARQDQIELRKIPQDAWPPGLGPRRPW